MSGTAVVDFEANRFPLEPGVRLLEASAGTGKTFALAHLVLRLVTHPQTPLPLEQLLVVTFTEAAAAELRDRIAQRLQQALAALEQGGSAADAVLAAWLAEQPGELQARQRLQGLLLVALEGLDRAAITTIHGFCRRTLQRQALEAGLGPALDLENDDGEGAAQVIHDIWHQQLLPLPAGLLAGLQRQGLSPERLERLLRRLDGDPALELDPLPPEISITGSLAAQLPTLVERRWHAFLASWAERGEALEQAFRQSALDWRSRCAGASQAKAPETRPYAAKPKRDRVAELNTWIGAWQASGTAPNYGQVLEQELLSTYFHPAPFTQRASGFEAAGGAEGQGRAVTLPEQPLLEAIAALVDGPVEAAWSHVLHQGRAELVRRRAARGRIGFGDLLAALDPGPDGKHHRDLLTAVGERYRVALIDEFQDTDPIQWRILERAFVAPKDQAPRHLLVMVGDPKQAIYRFRGGELATYRQARGRAEAIFGLRENRRSSAPLVDALNALMKPGLVRSRLAVPEVLARSEKGELRLEPGEAPLQLLPLGGDEALPGQVAGLCLQLLQRGLRIRSPDADGATRERPLTPGDLCLLVGSHRQAEQLRHALEQRGLPSRLVSRGDVFASEAAAALQRLLDALADPGDPGRQRLLAASPLLGWSPAELAAAPPEAWDRLADRLAALAPQLERGGLLACLGELLSTGGLARLALGGRLLADLQQAAELVQERMHQLGLGAAAAADWLRRLRLEPDRRVPEEHQLNSTAADAAIAVVTVHRSKGLEYPVVICPYLGRAPKPPSSHPDAVGRRWLPADATAPRLDLHRSPHWGRGRQAALADQAAALQESERLAYVAATRARHLLVLGWRHDDRHLAGPLVPWLLVDGTLSGQPERPLQLLDPADLPAAAARWRPPAPSGTLQGGPLPHHRLDTSWGRSSYSSWVHSGSGAAPEARDDGRDTGDATDAATDDDRLIAEPSLPAAAVGREARTWSREGPLAGFPRGSGPGEALHRILEQFDFQQAADSDTVQALISRELERAGLAAAWAAPLTLGLEQLRRTPFGGGLGAFRLAQLAPTERLNEMNFDLPLAVSRHPDPTHAGTAQVRSAALARCFRDHPGGLFGADYAARLASLEITSRGILTGSIDLVFCHRERWWVLDWKSNWLGERDANGAPLACGPVHYGEAAMARLMTASHYPLQAHLYLVALHRYLRWRLPGYNPERHLGGYAYVFLRGVPGPIAAAETRAAAAAAVPGVLVEQPPLTRLLALETLLREGAR